MIDLIGIDADDTLWQNEELYIEARRWFDQIVGRSSIDEPIDDIMERVETANLPYYGYGVASFVLSLVEAAVSPNDSAVSVEQIRQVLAIGKKMIDAEVTLFDEVEETLAELAAEYPLMLITKGDLLHQEAKVERSGLAHYFNHVQVVSEKSATAYESVLARWGVDPECFVMIGNSMRSDILPVLEIGGRAIYIPQELTWSLENAAAPENIESRYFEIASLGQVPGLIREISASN